jgi:hypothetical protein
MLEAQRWTAAPSLIDATLKLSDGRVTGKLTNRSDKPLTNVRIRTSSGVARLEVQRSRRRDDRHRASDRSERSLAGDSAARSLLLRPPGDGHAYPAAGLRGHRRLDVPRSTRLATLLAHGDRACVYGEILGAAAPLDVPVATDQKHMAFVRSLVRLDNSWLGVSRELPGALRSSPGETPSHRIIPISGDFKLLKRPARSHRADRIPRTWTSSPPSPAPAARCTRSGSSRASSPRA